MTSTSCKQSYAKNWCFTAHQGEVTFDEKSMAYMVYQPEVAPTTGQNHLQGYISFHKCIRLSGLKKLNATAHWEVARGTPHANKVYCTKEESRLPGSTPIEHGEMPMSQAEAGGLAMKRKYEDAVAAAVLGNFEAIPAPMLVRHYNTWKQIRTDFAPKPSNLDTEDVGVWLYGAPGCGKTLFCQQFDPYMKNQNKWWCGYQKQEAVLVDDVEPEAAKSLTLYLKLWAQQYPIQAEMKGSSALIRPRVIIVTSNYTAADIWKEDGAKLAAIQRRYKHFNMPFEADAAKKHIDEMLHRGLQGSLPEAV